MSAMDRGQVDLTDTTDAMAREDIDGAEPIDADLSLGELLSRLTDDFGDLVTTQVQLARVEIKDEVARAGRGAGMLGGGGVAAHLALLLLSMAAAWGLAEVMAPGWAFLIIGAIWAVVPAALVMAGRNRLSGIEPIPQTRTSVKEDIQWARQQRT